MNRSGFTVSWIDYLRHGSTVPISFLIVFYINYCFFIPRFLFEGRIKQYIILNLLLITLHRYWCTLLAGFHLPYLCEVHSSQASRTSQLDIYSARRILNGSHCRSGSCYPYERSLIKVEAARREAEKSRTEAELKNLRNQLNPHFLLNTLNNIYALIAFDSDKAQAAVQELSRLLRHVLYDNQQNFVALGKEMDFIRNYIELMRIRLASNVTVETQIDVRCR